MAETADEPTSPRAQSMTDCARVTAPAGEDTKDCGPRLSAEMSQLVIRIASGDRDALAELYDQTVSRLLRLAVIVVRDWADAEEVVCDVYTHVWRRASDYDPKRGSVWAWLLVACRSRAIDRRRANSRGALRGPDSQGDADAAPGPEDLLLLAERGSALHRALEGLTPLRRHLVSLAFLHGMTHAEIAAETSLAIGTVKSHLKRALATLRSELESEGSCDASPTA